MAKAKVSTIAAEDRLLKVVPDVTTLTGFSRAKVYRLIKTGILPTVRVGGSVRVRYRALMDWMRDAETPAGKPAA